MRTRLVVCVDGTWLGPDGRDGAPRGNISNMFRIWAVVKEGFITDDDGRRFEQKKKYFDGIGVGKKCYRRLNDGIWGTGCHAQIKEVYQYCCETLSGPEDELWLYGYSRGAFVVRAAAGLVHHLQLLQFQSQSHFDGIYDTAVHNLVERTRNGGRNTQGQLYRHFYEAVREPPEIRFVGVFDSVKAFDDGQFYDISYTRSIDHLRHAVSLNENRPYFNAELIHLSEDPDISNRPRSMIQAWFLGTHSDLGGGSRDDGLSLYPLQWILIESRRFGLVLEFRQIEHGGDLIEDPLEVVFPADSKPSSPSPDENRRSEPGLDSGNTGVSWLFKYKGGIQVQLHDLRLTHRRRIVNHEVAADIKATSPTSRKRKDGWFDNILSTSRKKSMSKDSAIDESTSATVSTPYRIRFNTANQLMKNPRKPFQKHKLNGYDEKGRT